MFVRHERMHFNYIGSSNSATRMQVQCNWALKYCAPTALNKIAALQHSRVLRYLRMMGIILGVLEW